MLASSANGSTRRLLVDHKGWTFVLEAYSLTEYLQQRPLSGHGLAMRLAERMRLDVEERRGVYHQAMLRYIGCNADTHLLASAFGDEISLRQDLAVADLGSQTELGQVFIRAFSAFLPTCRQIS